MGLSKKNNIMIALKHMVSRVRVVVGDVGEIERETLGTSLSGALMGTEAFGSLSPGEGAIGSLVSLMGIGANLKNLGGGGETGGAWSGGSIGAVEVGGGTIGRRGGGWSGIVNVIAVTICWGP